MCMMETIFDASIEDEGVHGILCIEFFPRQSSHVFSLDIFCVIWGYHVQHSITQTVYKIET